MTFIYKCTQGIDIINNMNTEFKYFAFRIRLLFEIKDIKMSEKEYL